MNSREVIKLLNSDEIKFDYTASRRDLTAFNLLDKLVPGKDRIIGGSDHDIIWLSVNIDELAEVATPDDIKQLAQLGVFWSDEYDCLSMFT